MWRPKSERAMMLGQAIKSWLGRTTPPELGNPPGVNLGSAQTLVMGCGPGFSVRVPNAASTIRLGFSRGFVQAGVSYRLASVHELDAALESVPGPLVFLSAYDYLHLGATARRALRDVPHFVWVNPWFDGLERLYAEHGLPDPRLPETIVKRMAETAPAFVWAPVPPSCLAFYETWERRGFSVRSIPLACDTDRYFADERDPRYSDVPVAFVGGYRTYKNVQYEKYLRPYEDRLRVYGYDTWPYSGYRGLLPDGDERVLYQNARVCPALSEPHAEIMGDIVERAFKIMASGGLAIPDAVPFYRELFAADELLVPSDVAEFHEMVNAVLTDAELNERLRRRGTKAVMARHTYAHRARQILDWLEPVAEPSA